jgi:ribosomal protein S18 acetylase RimI-like enzyme
MVIRGACWDDLDRVAELLGEQIRSPSSTPSVRIEHLRCDWEQPGFTVGLDNVVAADDGEVPYGYAAMTIERELVLAAEDDAVADALLGHVSERARSLGADALTVTLHSPGGPLSSLIARHPFSLVTETLTMRRPLTDPIAVPPIPDGIALRTFEPKDAKRVHGLLDEAYLGWDRRYVPMAHDSWVRWMTGDSEFDASVWWLAERDTALLGCALFWNTGWLKDIAVAASERGRGLGAALVQQGLAEFSRRGAAAVGLKVDAANPTGAVRLYARHGFATVNRETVWSLPL